MKRSINLHSVFLFSSILSSLILLSGCSAARYGMSEQQWKTLSSAQQKSMRNNYHYIAATRAREKREQDRQRITADTPKLIVEIEGGKAMMPPFDSRTEFDPVHFIVYQGHCRAVTLAESEGERTTELEACYLGNLLYIDPSKTEFKWHQGSLQFHYNPLWDSEKGFLYSNISSQGYAGLSDTKIRVKTSTSSN